jgi:D-amino peptidase
VAVNVFVSVDMEGIAGIAHLRQVFRGSDDFPMARRLMTEEANAGVAGAIDGGASTVVVNDSHGDMYNLLPEDMDRRAELVLGSPKVPGSMMQGFGPEFGVCLFIGYHAAAGTEAAVLDHTYAGRVLYDVRVNGRSWTEAELNAALAGRDGVPVGLITGDDKACAQAAAHIPGIRTVVVKEGMGKGVARSKHPEAARTLIRQAAAEVVAGVGELEPYRAVGPFALEVDVLNTGIADLCSLIPAVTRPGPRTLRFESADFGEVFRCLLAFTYLGMSEAPRYAGP